MPSSTAIVLNSKGTPPASRIASLTISPDLLQVDVAGHDVDVGVGDGDERLVEVLLAADHARAPEQSPVGRSLETLLDLVGTHGLCLSSYRRRLDLCPDCAAQIWIVRYDKRAGKGWAVDRGLTRSLEKVD